jgi:hypothetical protein
VRIELTRGTACETINSEAPNTGSFTWDSVSRCGDSVDGYRIRVADDRTGSADESDAFFSIE